MLIGIHLFIFTLSSCKRNNCPTQGQIENNGEIISNVSIAFDSSITSNEYVIRNSSENSVKAKLKFDNRSTFDTINFDDYTLLGKNIVFQSGGIIKKRNLTINTTRKEAICTIEIESCGQNKVGLSKVDWLLTSKIPDDYTVKFDVTDN